MPDKPILSKPFADDLRLPRVMMGAMAALLLVCVVVAYLYGTALATDILLAEETRVTLRTVLYWVALVTLPLTNLIRHIQLRLNQTMPSATSAKSRYFLTVLVSILLCDSIGFYGLLLFYLGDGFNTLVIFSTLSALGLFLYRPKRVEYRLVVEALADKQARSGTTSPPSSR